MTELMIVVAIIGVLSAVTISVSGNEWRRERVNTVASELAGFLQAVRRAAMKGAPCSVSISSGSFNAASAPFATTPLAECGSSQNVRITTISGNDSYNITSTTASFKFTPRGTVNGATANTQLTDPIVVTININNSGPTRCVRIQPGLGLISIGSGNGTTCDANSYGGRF